MIKFDTFRISAVISCIICIGVSGYAQPLKVETRLEDYLACSRTNLSIPVKVTNMIGVDSFLLTFKYDQSVLTYSSFSKVNVQLASGKIHISDKSGIVTVSWHGISPANILNDRLVEFLFRTKSGTGALTWDTLQPGNSIYMSGVATLPGHFISGSVKIYPAISVSLDQIDPTCAIKCDANFAAFARGGSPPYKYLWNAKRALFDSIQTGLCAGPNSIRITDTKGCVLDSNYSIKGLPATNVLVNVSPDSILYMQNPTLTFSFERRSNVTITAWLWSFGDGDTSRLLNPVHTYVGVETYKADSYPLTLYVKNEYGCDTTILMRIPVKAAELTIPNVITPNGDGQNDLFKIVNRGKQDKFNNGGVVDKEYLRLEVVIFDRWGKLKFESNDYHSDWGGGNLPDGIYFYVLKAHGFFRIDKFKGSLTILGSSK